MTTTERLSEEDLKRLERCEEQAARLEEIVKELLARVEQADPEGVELGIAVADLAVEVAGLKEDIAGD